MNQFVILPVRSRVIAETVLEQTTLVVLQTIAGAFNLDHSIAPLLRPKLHQICRSRAVFIAIATIHSNQSFRCSGVKHASALQAAAAAHCAAARDHSHQQCARCVRKRAAARRCFLVEQFLRHLQ